MPGKEVKELYVAKSLDELINRTKITKLDYSPKVLQKSAKMLHGDAMKDLSKGDEEKSYILFMKFVEIALHVKRMKDVSDKEFEETCGSQNVKFAMSKLEELQKSLRIRYAELEKSKGGSHTVVDSSPKVVKEETDKSKGTGELSNGSLDGKQSSVKLADQLPTSSISSLDLQKLIKEGKYNVLLMDTRSADDYAKSHMCFKKSAPHYCRHDLITVINVPRDVLNRGLIPKSLEKLLPVESLIGWNKRKDSDLIVLLDWDTDNSTTNTDSPVVILKEIMTKWEMEISYKHPPIILERGYFDWVNTFPMMTTNPHIKTPIKTKSTSAIIPKSDLYFSNLMNQDDILDDLDDVEYPALIDSPPKVTPQVLDENSASIPKAFPSVTKSGSTEKGVAPVIDRSSKPAALSSPKASPVTPTITKKPILPSVPAEVVGGEQIPKETIEKKSDTEVQPEPSNVNKYVEGEESNKISKEEIRLSPKINKDHVKVPSKVINEDIRIPPKVTNEDARVLPKIIKDDVKTPPTVKKVPVVDRTLKAKVLQQPSEEEKGQTSNMENRRGSKEEPEVEENRKPSEVSVKQNNSTSTNYLRDEKKEVESSQLKKKIEKDEWHIPINFEPSPGSSMKRSRSFQNVSRLMEDQECPKVNRSIKPVSKTEVLATRRRIDGVYGNVGRGLTGLRNLGNSCYMNSILQCINHTTILVKYFCDGKYRDDVNRSTKMKGEVAEEVAALVRALWSGEYRSIACRGLKGVVGMHKEAFAGYEQQDSHEFLTILMDWLHEDLNRAGQRSIQNYNSEGSNQNASGLEGAVKAWKEFCSKNESLVLQLFYGQQASTVRCLTCREESVTYEPFSNLSLPLPPNATRCTLSDCMSLYLKGEIINGWNCPRCKEPRDAIKKFDIWILPQILVIHFKRFTSDGWCRKKQTMVDFPLEDLDVSSWDSSSGSFSHHRRNTLYNLYGVSNHYGTIDGGHYTAHCKSSLFHKWYKFDDHEVSELSPSDVVSPAAYILFYSSVDVS